MARKFLATDNDGALWAMLESGLVVPANEAGAANNFLTAYNSSTGAWTKARPTWANVDKTTSDIADITTKSHASLSTIGSNTHAQLDTGQSDASLLVRATSKILAQSWDYVINNNASAGALTDGQVIFEALYLPTAATLTGVLIGMIQQGSYTSDNNNKVGLYTSDGATLTRVAQSTDDGTLWKASSGSTIDKAFSSTYAAARGLYYVAMLYNNSAQVTAPTITRLSLNSSVINAGITSGYFRVGTLSGQTDLPSTQAVSGIAYTGGSGQVNYWCAVY